MSNGNSDIQTYIVAGADNGLLNTIFSGRSFRLGNGASVEGLSAERMQAADANSAVQAYEKEYGRTPQFVFTVTRQPYQPTVSLTKTKTKTSKTAKYTYQLVKEALRSLANASDEALTMSQRLARAKAVLIARGVNSVNAQKADHRAYQIVQNMGIPMFSTDLGRLRAEEALCNALRKVR